MVMLSNIHYVNHGNSEIDFRHIFDDVNPNHQYGLGIFCAILRRHLRVAKPVVL